MDLVCEGETVDYIEKKKQRSGVWGFDYCIDASEYGPCHALWAASTHKLRPITRFHVSKFVVSHLLDMMWPLILPQ